MSMLEDLKKDALWEAFIEEKQYHEIVGRLTEEGVSFDYPEKILVNKSGTGKKRIVYSFGEKETAVLKVMAFLLYRYDDKISKRCYLFRRNCTAKDAVVRIPG